MMPFKKHEKYAKNVVFTERKEPKRDFLERNFFENLLVEKLFFQNLTRC